MMQTPNAEHETGLTRIIHEGFNTLSLGQSITCAFDSDAARHSRNESPETKPDLFSITQNIESRSVNVINHAALHELTS
jgi:hypothetical protein